MSNKPHRRGQPPRANRVVQPEKRETYFARASRAGSADIVARVPELRTLPERTVAVFGLGALGAPAAIEFARSGVGSLQLVDHDTVDSGNIVRWPLGIPVVGMHKVKAIGGFIDANYPYTKVGAGIGRIGGAVLPGDPEGPSQLETIGELLDEVDLIYDATAEPGVWHALSDLARDAGIPYVHTWATAGAWGGVAARVLPDRPGCWVCLEHHYTDGTIAPPNEDPAGQIQPAGCADPTFTGSNFDLTTIAHFGVRLAIATLCSNVEGGYPDSPWDVGVVNLRDRHGQPNFEIDTHVLTSHPRCGQCAA